MNHNIMKTLLLLIICPVLVSPLYASDSNYIKCEKYLNGINVEVEVESSKFNKNNHEIKKLESNQISIDGLKPIGAPVIPTWEVSNFKIFINGKSIDIPEYYYKNCHRLKNMRFTGFIIILLIWPIMAFGGEFKIGEYRRYGADNYIELWRTTKGGQSFKKILNLIEPSHESFNIRILSPLTDESKKEIMSFYNNNFSNKLQKALSSTGNLHNPTLIPLIHNFDTAFRSTLMYKDFESSIEKKDIKYRRLNLKNLKCETETYSSLKLP